MGTREPHLVVGVMPPAFNFPNDCQVWFPLPRSTLPKDNGHFLRVVAKLRPGAPLTQARAELDTISAQLRGTYPDSPVIGVTLVPLQQQIVGDSRQGLVVLLGAVGVVLLTALFR